MFVLCIGWQLILIVGFFFGMVEIGSFGFNWSVIFTMDGAIFLKAGLGRESLHVGF